MLLLIMTMFSWFVDSVSAVDIRMMFRLGKCSGFLLVMGMDVCKVGVSADN